MRLLSLMGVCACFAGMLLAQDMDDGTLGFCKSDKQPADRIVVAEFESPQCDPIATKNAWDTAAPTDGLTACQSSKPASAFASVLELVVCERVYSPKCPERKDGMANAYVWRSPDECLKHQTGSAAGPETVSRLRLVCNREFVKLEENESVIAHTKSDRCTSLAASKEFLFADNALIVRRYGKTDAIVTSCVGSSGKPIGKKLAANDVILRH